MSTLNARFSKTILDQLAAAKGLTRAQQRRIDRLKNLPERRRVRVLENLQNHAAEQYEAATGKKVKSFGDGAFLQWLIDNADKWIPLLLKILALFGL